MIALGYNPTGYCMPAADAGRWGLPSGWRLLSIRFDHGRVWGIAIERITMNGQKQRHAVHDSNGLAKACAELAQWAETVEG
jgi:hypothetical protein